MKIFEYKETLVSIEYANDPKIVYKINTPNGTLLDALNKQGADGWEVVRIKKTQGHTPLVKCYKVIFKREKTQI